LLSAVSQHNRNGRFPPLQTFSTACRIRRPRGGQIAIERRGRHPDTLGDLGNRNIGVRKQRRRDIKTVVGQFRRSASRASCTPCGG